MLKNKNMKTMKKLIKEINQNKKSDLYEFDATELEEVLLESFDVQNFTELGKLFEEGNYEFRFYEYSNGSYLKHDAFYVDYLLEHDNTRTIRMYIDRENRKAVVQIL